MFHSSLWSVQFPVKIGGEKFYSYPSYLKSIHWKDLRGTILERDKGVCYCCKRPHANIVHHLTYKNFPRTRAKNLITVCKSCHGEIHKAFHEDSDYFHKWGGMLRLVKDIRRKYSR